MLKVELGGGCKPRGSDWVNVDHLENMPGVDFAVEFEQLGHNNVKLPFEDDSVDEVYSSHTLEHVENVCGVLREIARICKLGAPVEIRVPHWLSNLAMCAGHKHVVCEQQVGNWCIDFISEWWSGCKKRLRIDKTQYIPWTATFERAKKLYPHFSEQDLFDFVPGCVHEVRFFFTVISND